MNVFGIDHQASLTSVILAGGTDGSWAGSSVGDDCRDFIPHFVSRTAWGSAAAANPAGEIWRNPDGRAGAWLEQPGAALFWRGLCERLCRFLGGTSPTLANGYRCIVALSTDSNDAHGAVLQLVQSAGVVEAECIRSTSALLCEWLNGSPSVPVTGRTVVTVVCSDSSIFVRVFRVERNGDRRPNITPSGCEMAIQFGHADFVRIILDQIAIRSPPKNSRSLSEEVCLTEAVFTFAALLNQAPAQTPVLWAGPFREQMFTNFRLAPDECRAWPEVTALSFQLPRAISEAAQDTPTAPDEIVVGGIGSMWPFFSAILKKTGSVVSFRDPAQAIALGASLWPRFSPGFRDRQPMIKLLDAPVAPQELSATGNAAVDNLPKRAQSSLPPWQR